MWTLVTGAGRGLGAAIVNRLADEGHQVLVHYRTQKPKGAHNALWGDFSTPKGIESFIQELPQPLTALVNNVGVYRSMSLSEADSATWEQILHPNLLAPALLANVVADQGAIVHIGVAGLLANRAPARSPLYTVTKQALWALTRAQAKEWAPRKTRVNMVSPGQLENSVDLHASMKPEDLPMGRTASYPEVADLVAYLLSDKASYVTGQNIEIAGGYAL